MSTCPPGSTVIMTDNAFMTSSAWIKTSKSVAPNLKNCDPKLQKLPNAMLLKVIDGFGCHLDNEEANTLYTENNTRLMKESGYLSHLIQSYDQFVTLKNKTNQRDLLTHFVNDSSNVCDQWDLLTLVISVMVDHDRDVWGSHSKKSICVVIFCRLMNGLTKVILQNMLLFKRKRILLYFVRRIVLSTPTCEAYRNLICCPQCGTNSMMK